MSAAQNERLICVGPATRETRLSILTPFYRHDPSQLIARLGKLPPHVEWVLLDDGTGSSELLARVREACEAARGPARIVVWSENRGRAAARNRLVGAAHGEYVLFLDADMAPDSSRFLQAWLGVIQTQRPFIAFGGLSVAQAPQSRDTALHRDLFARSDCLPARVRQRRPAQCVATANLLVRRDLALETPFDDAYVGWGFEDVDWALTASRSAPILHVDNPASHAGLDDIDALIRKGAEAGRNFARLAAKHPRQVARFAAHRAARLMRLSPMRRQLRALFAWLARDPVGAAPMALRRAAFKFYRVCCYAEHLA